MFYGIELLYFAMHNGDVFPIVQNINGIQDKQGIGSFALVVQQAVPEYFGAGHDKYFCLGALINEGALFFYFRL